VSVWDAATQRADVVILTALRLEFDAVLAVDAGAVSGSAWEIAAGPRELPVAFRSFVGDGGAALRVAVAVSADMGATAAVHALLPLVEVLQPRCVAMCGVCAGPRGATGLGDVVAAERLYVHDTGRQLPDRVQHDLATYKLRDDWRAALEALDPVAQFRDALWFQGRPLTTEWREHRALLALRDGIAEPWHAVEPKLDTAAWKRTVDALRERKLLAASGRTLTAKGEQAAEDLLFAHHGALPDLSPAGDFQPFRLHVAAIASGARVIEDESIWRLVSQAMHKTLAIDMEAAVLGELVHRARDRRLDALVMKGVMDFAHQGRDDHFKEFAARASAECLLWFLRQALRSSAVR
jgi:nucleoside phosphorylase